MAPLLIPAEWVEDKLNLYKKLKADIMKEIISLTYEKTRVISKETADHAASLHHLYARYKDCEVFLKEMKEASITKP